MLKRSTFCEKVDLFAWGRIAAGSIFFRRTTKMSFKYSRKIMTVLKTCLEGDFGYIPARIMEQFNRFFQPDLRQIMAEGKTALLTEYS
jgi:hypothetical protein